MEKKPTKGPRGADVGDLLVMGRSTNMQFNSGRERRNVALDVKLGISSLSGRHRPTLRYCMECPIKCSDGMPDRIKQELGYQHHLVESHLTNQDHILPRELKTRPRLATRLTKN